MSDEGYDAKTGTAAKVACEMSEDPVKYEPLEDPYDPEHHAKYAEGEKHPGEPDTVRPEWEDQRIRIEALRAAASCTTASQDHVADILGMAKQFAAYLESGE